MRGQRLFEISIPWLWPIIAAPFIGSFLGMLVTRLTAGRRIAWDRSTCDHCGHKLGVLDLVPIASWLAAQGRCRHCGAAVTPLYLVLELGALGIAIWAATISEGWVLWASCALGWCLLALAAIDWRDGLLPDALTLPLIPFGLAVAYAEDPTSLVNHAVGALAGFVAFALVRALYRRLRGRDGLGLGDVKLLAAAGAIVSWEGLPSVVLIAAIAGLLVVLASSLLGRRIALDQRIPFGPALCLGLWLVWLYGPLG